MDNLVEIVDIYSRMVGLMGEIINDLFMLLSQHMTVDELNSLDCTNKINMVAELESRY